METLDNAIMSDGSFKTGGLIGKLVITPRTGYPGQTENIKFRELPDHSSYGTSNMMLQIAYTEMIFIRL